MWTLTPGDTVRITDRLPHDWFKLETTGATKVKSWFSPGDAVGSSRKWRWRWFTAQNYELLINTAVHGPSGTNETNRCGTVVCQSNNVSSVESL